jgi:hypothetical protein
MMDIPLPVLLAIVVGSYLVFNLPLAISSENKAMPVRYVVVLAIVSALSLVWLGAGTPYAMTYWGPDYVRGIWISNAIALAALWGMWIGVRHDGARLGVVVFATFLHAWLCGWAFPWLGELP